MELSTSAPLSKHMDSVLRGGKGMELSTSAPLYKHMVPVLRGAREWSLVPLRLYLSTWFRCEEV
jgi:hypothetical protein